MKLDIIAFTANGTALAEKILGLFPDSEAVVICAGCSCHSGIVKPFTGNLFDWTQARFKTGNALVFIGAAGIAIRAIAPFLRDKDTDAAVICVDERGENVIPLLSGHLGGANRAANKLADALGARAVITTATDLNGIFAVDTWAKKNNCAMPDISAIKFISSALLSGKKVGLRSEFPIDGKLPTGITREESVENGIEIAFRSVNPFTRTLHLIPLVVIAGIGCRKGVSADILEQRLRAELAMLEIPIEAVKTVASIDLKAGEPGLISLCEGINAEFTTFTPEELMSAKGEFAKSERVLRETGADNVCERAVVCAGGKIISGKSTGDGVAVALGRLDGKISFKEALN